MDGHRIDVHHHILPPEYVATVGDDRFGPRILSGRTPEWTPAMSIEARERNGIATAVKLYPAGATTNSASGVRDFDKVRPVLETMAEIGMPLPMDFPKHDRSGLAP